MIMLMMLMNLIMMWVLAMEMLTAMTRMRESEMRRWKRRREGKMVEDRWNSKEREGGCEV